ncbi:MAG: selenite/tellurite reduction operon porin ExtI [Desulfuromonadaceae bacterium]|nr:selenite/tellurite reduction operon porin ExtI [Desulfuromonadaceae bacterium]MDD2850097.1 selenite/tellurite reduction operon porin ExtI [Desulfuromonadaceae bacterium]MDD4130356.1 selenite/tellurite reduction operon porin ExtI [Desulfuromonadaceae bacterium]
MLKKPGFSQSCKAVAAGSALLLGLGFAAQAQAGPRIEFGDEGGFLQIDLKGQIYVENTDYGGGPNGDQSRTDIHFMRNRLGLTGMIDETWGYKIQTCGNTGSTKTPIMYGLSAQETDWNDRDVRVIDAYAIGRLNEYLNLKVGLTKIPLTRANLDDCFAPLSLDRSMFVYSAYGTSPAKFSRDMGAVASGRFMDERLTYFAGIFQGREGTAASQIPLGPTAGLIATSTTAPKTSLQYVGRATVDFLESEGGSGYQGTYFGEKKVFNIGFGMAFQPDAAFRNTTNVFTYSNGTTSQGPAPVIPAGSVVTKVASRNTNNETVDYTAYAVDMMFEYPTSFGIPTLTAQYLNADFDDAYKTSFASAERIAVISGLNGQKEGYYVKAAHILPITVGKAGKIQPYALFENWKFAHLLGVNNQKIKQYGVGVNYYVSGDQRVRITGEFLKTDFDTPATLPVAGTTGLASVKNFDTFRTMLQVVF